MGIPTGPSNCKSAELSMVIIRADGTKQDLGVVSYYSRNPIKQLIWNLKNWIKRNIITPTKGD